MESQAKRELRNKLLEIAVLFIKGNPKLGVESVQVGIRTCSRTPDENLREYYQPLPAVQGTVRPGTGIINMIVHVVDWACRQEGRTLIGVANQPHIMEGIETHRYWLQ